VTGPSFFPEALAEYEDAVVSYETREEGLGGRLVREFDLASPWRWSFRMPAPWCTAPARFGLRWVMLQSFPVKRVYTVRDDALVIVAVFHPRRRPGYWFRRLKNLDT
jgi:hypothetical protein